MACRKPHLSMYGQERVKHMLDGVATTREVVENLQKENISVCHHRVWRLQHHLDAHGTVEKLPKSGRPTKLTSVVLQQIDKTMTRDDETMAKELQSVFTSNGVSVSAKTALKGRRLLGWTSSLPRKKRTEPSEWQPSLHYFLPCSCKNVLH